MIVNLRNLVAAISLFCVLDSSALGWQDGAVRSAREPMDTSSLIGGSSGKITDSLLTNSSTIVINIQDLHGHPEVQRNIARILGDIDKRFPVNTVFVEGGSGSVDTSWLCGITDGELRSAITENLVDQGVLTGSEYYSVLSKRPLLLQGIEDGMIHRENILRLGTLLAREPGIQRELAELEADLSMMKARHFSRRSRRFDTRAAQFRAGTLASDEYFDYLSAYARNICSHPALYKDAAALGLDRFPNIARYCAAARAARRINSSKAAREFTSFIRRLESGIPFNEYQALRGATDQHADWSQLASRYTAAASSHHITLDTFPHLQKFFSWHALNASINPIELVREQAALERHIRKALAQDQTEEDIAFLAEYFPIFRDFMLRRVSAEQYAFALEHSAAFHAAWASYARFSRVEEMNDDFNLAASFHAVNMQRNNLFLRHLPLDNLRIAANQPAARAPEAIVLVTGGFHSDGLKALLRERGVSFLLITPSITTAASPAGQRYDARAREQAAQMSRHAIQLGLASQAATPDKFRFYISGAQKLLRAMPFTRENINALAEQLQTALGENALAVSINTEKETATISFRGGQAVTLAKHGLNNTIDTAGTTFPQGPHLTEAMSEAVMRALAQVLRSESITAETLVGLVPMFAATGDILIRLAVLAADHGFIYGNGYTIELRNDEHLRAYINDRLGVIAALLPDAVQHTAVEDARREQRLQTISRSDLMKSVMAVDLLCDLLTALLPPEKEPAPILLQETIAWADFKKSETEIFPACPVCHSNHNKPIGAVIINNKPLVLAQCDACSMIWYRTRPPVSFFQQLYGPAYFGYTGRGFEPHGQTETSNVGIRTHPDIESIARRGVAQWREFLPDSNDGNTPMKGLNIVEVGPGNGHLLLEAKRQGATVFGVDISEFIIEQLHGKGIEGYAGQLQNAGIAPGSADAIAAYDLIEHVFDSDLFLDTVFDILKPGGFLFIRTPDTNNNTPYLHLIDHVLHFSHHTLQRALEKHGFIVRMTEDSGKFEGPDGKMIDNVTMFAQKPVEGRAAALTPLGETRPPRPDPLPGDHIPVLRETGNAPDADALSAMLSAA